MDDMNLPPCGQPIPTQRAPQLAPGLVNLFLLRVIKANLRRSVKHIREDFYACFPECRALLDSLQLWEFVAFWGESARRCIFVPRINVVGRDGHTHPSLATLPFELLDRAKLSAPLLQEIAHANGFHIVNLHQFHRVDTDLRAAHNGDLAYPNP